MPIVTAGDITELVIKSTLEGQQIINRFHFEAGASFTTPNEGQPELQALADACKELFRAQQSTRVAYTSWEARQRRGAGVTYTAQGNQVGGWVAEGTLTGTLTGAQVTEAVPNQVAAVVSWKTGQAGRRKRGRSYIAGIDEANHSLSQWSVAMTAQQQTALNTHIGVYGASGSSLDWTQGIWSDRTATGKRLVYDTQTGKGTLTPTDTPAPQNAWTDITSAVVYRELKTQRRRALGTGV